MNMDAPHTMTQDAAEVVIEDLVKHYDDTVALAGVSFDVKPGELFGVIGPDGAGKSTLFRILVTVLTPDTGRATVDGLDVVADYRTIRERVGYMPGQFSLYQDLTVEENLRFFASVFGTTVEQGYSLIAPIYSQIEPFKRRRAGALSGGMKQKLALSCALVHKPRVLILDEPTTGVDAVSRREFWDMLAELRAGGITTLVSTAYMDEAARCDRISLMQEGKLLGSPGAPEAVAGELDRPLVRVRAKGERASLLTDLRSINGVDAAYAFGEWMHVRGDELDDASLIARVERGLKEKGCEDVFVEQAEPKIGRAHV